MTVDWCEAFVSSCYRSRNLKLGLFHLHLHGHEYRYRYRYGQTFGSPYYWAIQSVEHDHWPCGDRISNTCGEPPVRRERENSGTTPIRQSGRVFWCKWCRKYASCNVKTRGCQSIASGTLVRETCFSKWRKDYLVLSNECDIIWREQSSSMLLSMYCWLGTTSRGPPVTAFNQREHQYIQEPSWERKHHHPNDHPFRWGFLCHRHLPPVSEFWSAFIAVCRAHIHVYLQVHCPLGQAQELPQLQEHPGADPLLGHLEVIE